MNRDELISAYVDDALDPSERGQVERLLAEDAAARRLCHELRAARDALRSLPRLRVGEDLSAAVLREAERRMLLGHESAEPAQPPGRFWTARLKRPAFWAALTLAAGLLIMFLSREPEQPSVAVAPADKAPTGGVAAGTEVAESMWAAPDDAPAADAVASANSPPAPPAGGGAPQPRAMGKGGVLPTSPSERSEVATQAAPAPLESFGQSAQVAPSPESAARSLDASLAEAPEEGTIFICDATPEAVATDEFAKVLSNNQIRIEPPQYDQAEPSAEAEGQQAAGPAAPAVASTTLVVEATPEQILGVLDELNEKSDRFTVTVAPPATPPRKQNLQYSGEYVQQYKRSKIGRDATQTREAAKEAEVGNAWVVNRLTQAPGAQAKVEVPSNYQAPELLRERAQAEKKRESSAPLQSYLFLLRQTPPPEPSAAP